MLITKEIIQLLKNSPNSAYNELKAFLSFHTNKIEGSTFTKYEITELIENGYIDGKHSFDDVLETKNSLDLFDLMVDSLDEPLSESLVKEFHFLLKRATTEHDHGLAGTWKKVPNRITNVSLELDQPYIVQEHITNLLNNYNYISNHDLDDLCSFHAIFEKIHPFQDGNGRVGRIILFRECILNNIEMVCVDSKDKGIEYKKALFEAQETGKMETLINYFKASQKLLDKSLPNLKKDIEYINQFYFKNNNGREM